MVVLALVAALLGWTYDSRLIRSVALSLRHREFTRHAVFSGMRMPQILLREHLPYVVPIVFLHDDEQSDLGDRSPGDAVGAGLLPTSTGPASAA